MAPWYLEIILYFVILRGFHGHAQIVLDPFYPGSALLMLAVLVILPSMIRVLVTIIVLLAHGLCQSRRGLIVENLTLRQQLAVFNPTTPCSALRFAGNPDASSGSFFSRWNSIRMTVKKFRPRRRKYSRSGTLRRSVRYILPGWIRCRERKSP